MKCTKVIIVTLFCIGFVLGSASLTFGQGGAPPYAGLNYEKIALLKWYAANQSGASFAVDSSASTAMAFDGANMWVTNGGGATSSGGVTKLRAADGRNLGTFVVANNGDLGGVNVAFDGANVWVTDPLVGVHKLRAADGVHLCDVNVPSPLAVAFDGTYIFVG